jgi:polysaccharide biosynthesis/export protein
MIKRLGSLLCSLLVLNALVACGGNFAKPPTYPYEDPQFKTSNPEPPGLENDYPVPLVLMPGDTVTVRTLSNDTVDYEGLVVDDEGKVHVPIAGPVQVAGLAPHQAERTIEGVLQKFDRFVRVSVIVTGWGGHYATVIGAVVKEGAQTISPNMRLAELLASAGGPLRIEKEGELSYIADLDGARLMRKNQPVPVSIRLALTGDPRHNVLVHPGDQLFVPAGLGSRIAVLGTVGDVSGGGAMVTYRPGIRITEALALAGGVNFNSDYEDVRLIRGPLKKPKVYRWDLEALVEGRAGDIQLAPGDVVFVSEHWAATMGQVLDRVAPLLSIVVTGLQTWLLYETLKLQRDFRSQVNDNSDSTSGGDTAKGAITPTQTPALSF